MALAPSSDSFYPSIEVGCHILSDSASPSPQLSPRLSFSTNQASPSQKNPSTSHETLLCVKFNQDFGCFSCGTETGFRIFNCDPFTETFRRECDGEGIGHIEMLFRSNILALVGGGKSPRYSPNKVMLWDDNQQRCIGELSFRSKVRAVRLRRDRIVVVLEYRIYIYNFSDLKLLHQIGTTSNTKGLCELSPSVNACTLASLGQRKGEIRIELYTLKKTRLIQCHNSSIACIALCLDGTLLASASERGTLVRIFCTNDGTPLQELRRGAERAEIYSLAFSTNLQWLALSSNKGTVHVFCLKILPSLRSSDLYPPSLDNPSDKSITLSTGLMMAGSTLLSKASSNAGSSLSFIRGVLPKYFSSKCSLAQFRMPGDTMSIVAFGPQKNTIIIVCTNGSYYKCAFDPTQGGLMTQTEYGLYLENSEIINHEHAL